MIAEVPSEKVAGDLAGLLTSVEYIRERMNPEPGDQLYLHLSDLLLTMRRFASDEPLKILDFGCGGSPYRSLFPNARYDRADFEGTPGVDYIIPANGISYRLPVADGAYDLVLSSQVLEHVPTPQAYLGEAWRLLRNGGRLLLTTHGIFEDHGCPFDFRRWTDEGLRLEFETAGLSVAQLIKITTGPRAALFLLQQHQGYASRKQSLGLLLWWFNRLVGQGRASFDRQCDEAFGSNRVVTETLEQHRIYIGLLAVGERLS